MSALGDFESLARMTPAEIRSACHRTLLWAPGPHDEFIYLIRCGDNTSVPYIIWALRFMPSIEHRECTWGHALEALETITNNSPGSTRQAWAQWYAANKHRSRLEWWADGFTAAGYPVSAAGGPPSIHNLLKAAGRTLLEHRSGNWLTTNAMTMLSQLDKTEVRQVIDQVLSGGSEQEFLGLALRREAPACRGRADPAPIAGGCSAIGPSLRSRTLSQQQTRTGSSARPASSSAKTGHEWVARMTSCIRRAVRL